MRRGNKGKKGNRGQGSRASSTSAELIDDVSADLSSGLTWDEANIALTEIQKDSLM